MKLFRVEYQSKTVGCSGLPTTRTTYYERADNIEDAFKYALAGQRGGNGTMLSIGWVCDLIPFDVIMYYRDKGSDSIREARATLEGASCQDAKNRMEQRIAAQRYHTGISVVSWEVSRAVDGSKVEGVV